MVLDLDLFRAEKGGDPEALRANQRKRFKKTELVDAVVDIDALWRKLRFRSDLWNKIKVQMIHLSGKIRIRAV